MAIARKSDIDPEGLFRSGRAAAARVDVRPGISPAELREQFEGLERDMDRRFALLRQSVEDVTSGIEDLARRGIRIDLDQVIGQLEEYEDAVKQEAERAHREARRAMKAARGSARQLLPILNDAALAAGERYARTAAVYRDARWRLMSARAQMRRGLDAAGPVLETPSALRRYLAARR